MAALVCAVACVTVWLVLGANRGWTKTSRTHMEKDPVTEIEFPVTEKHFSPGLEWLGGGLLLSVILGSVSFFVGRKPRETKTNH